ncbi:MAG: hydantoinase/oxoprolinase family protein [Pseudomonadota bacterium]|nr:hydantoinase/oxoprolinase family protein [Pseudomonadota bacterium]
MSKARYLIGVDVGGTFTDLLAYDEGEHRLFSAKVPSLPGEQWRGVLDALKELEIPFDAIRAFVHGTTIATNALLQRRGAKTALVTTKGFRDVLEIGKGRRLTGGLFDATWQRPAPLVPRDMRYELAERIDFNGDILTALVTADLDAITEAMQRQQIEAVAVAFVNSYVNPQNEKEAAQALRDRLNDVPVTESAALIPERGEFERASTAVLNAYLAPVMSEYLAMLAQELSGQGITAPVNIMGSNGGAMTLEIAAQRCAGTFLSGPVGGVSGAVRVAESAQRPDIITFDMGGTSTDVALVHDLTPRMSHDNQIDAYPLRMPQLDIHTIGAGGGSIIWIGSDGTLQIGPQSAGALPGPACYGRGGAEPTISDANLLLGRLDAERPLAGGLHLDKAAAEAAFKPVADKLGTDDLVGVADGALSVAVAKMAGAVREVSVHRGFDPRDFVLVGFGGAGPMHGFLVAEELGMTEVLIPRFPGHLSALGQMMADLRRDLVKASGGRLSQLELTDLKREADELREQGTALLIADGIAANRQRHEFTMDMRYTGQSFTLAIPWNPDGVDFNLLRQAFDTRHEETFGYADRTNDAEIVNIRLVSIGEVDKPTLEFTQRENGEGHTGQRQVWFGDWTETTIYARDNLSVGHNFRGPAIVEEAGGTSIIPPDWTVTVGEGGGLLCRYTGAES